MGKRELEGRAEEMGERQKGKWKTNPTILEEGQQPCRLAAWESAPPPPATTFHLSPDLHPRFCRPTQQ